MSGLFRNFGCSSATATPSTLFTIILLLRFIPTEAPKKLEKTLKQNFAKNAQVRCSLIIYLEYWKWKYMKAKSIKLFISLISMFLFLMKTSLTSMSKLLYFKTFDWATGWVQRPNRILFWETNFLWWQVINKVNTNIVGSAQCLKLQNRRKYMV